MSNSNNQERTLSLDEQNAILTVWEKTLDVQMHFNDIEMKIRNLFISVMLALVGAIGWSLSKSYSIPISGRIGINFAVLLLGAGIIAAHLFRFMDKYWYHQLLVGAVKQTLALDDQFGKQIIALGLTTKISGSSPIKNFGSTILGKAFIFLKVTPKNEDNFMGDDLRSTGKIDLFYNVPIYIMLTALILSLLFGGVSIESKHGGGRSIVESIFNTIF